MLSLRHLNAFMAVCETGSFTAAGNILHRSVSAVSRSVALLEEQFGHALLDRAAARQSLTPEGATVLRRCVNIRTELRKCREQVMRYHGAGVPGSSALFTMLLDSVHLRALVAVRDFRSLQRAANLLGVSQPAISYSIRLLETEVGAALFSRLPGGMIATPAGESVAIAARRILAELARMFDDVRSARGSSAGLVHIGALAYSLSAVLPRAIRRMLEVHPEISVRTLEGHIDQLIAALHGGDLDALLCAMPDRSLLEGVGVEPLIRDQMVFYVRRDHPLAGQGPLPLEALLEFDFILPPIGTITRKLLEQFFHEHGLPVPRGRVETSSYLLVRALLTGADLIAFRTQREYENDLASGVMPLAMHMPLPQREICILTRRAAQPTAAVQAFLRIVRETIDE